MSSGSDLSADRLQPIIVEYVTRLEPLATCDGLARHLAAVLQKEDTMLETRPPAPGEYVDPQPAAVDTAADDEIIRLRTALHQLSQDAYSAMYPQPTPITRD